MRDSRQIGARAERELKIEGGTLTFGSYTCDATVLVRGTAGVVCPHCG